jgi:beta-lactamase class A
MRAYRGRRRLSVTTLPRTVLLLTFSVLLPHASATIPSNESGGRASTKAASPFGGTFGKYLRSRADKVAAAVFDEQTGRTWLFHNTDVQDTASIVKVDILATLLNEERPAGSLPGPQVEETAAEMIEESDNEAATELWEDVGAPAAVRYFDHELGMDETAPSLCLVCRGFVWPGWGLTTTTALDQVTLLRDLVLPNKWLSRNQRQWVLGLMEHIVSYERWGISDGVPGDVLVALKNGWVPLPSGAWQINTIGWVDGEGRDYIAAVLTTGNPTEQYGIDTVNAVGARLYSFLDRRK